jgi:DNA primase
LQGSINEGKIDEIRRRADIISLIGEYVALKKAGKNFVGLCPFHQEKTPSFTVSSEKQIFHCFGCGEHGDVFSFLMKINNLTFPEAVRQLAKKVGVDIPQRALSRKERENYTIREQILMVNGFAAEYFIGILGSQAGETARDYLKKRGIAEKAIEAFRIGFAEDGWQGLLDFLERKGISAEIAQQAGLVIPRSKDDKRGYYDRFRGRIIIPIEDSDGRIVAFGGRVMDAGEPKYLNSPESPVYTKGDNLFGLFSTKESIRSKGFAILVEGYFDLISLWSAGIKNVAATLGTALTRSQVDLLGRYTKRVAAVFDPDEAGRKALSRSLELFLAGNVQAMAVILPAGYDPDSFVRAEGRDKMEELVAGAQPMADYYIEEILGNAGTLEEDREKLRNAVAFVKKIDDAVERNLFIKKISQKLNIDQDVLKSEVGRAFSHSQPPNVGRTLTQSTREHERLELSLIHMLFEYPEMISFIRDTGILTFFKSEELKTVGEMLLMNSEKKGGNNSNMLSLLDSIEDGPIKKDLYRLLIEDSPYKGELKERLLSDTIKQIRHRWYKDRHRILKEKIARADKAGDKQLCDSLLLEKERLLMEERDFK